MKHVSRAALAAPVAIPRGIVDVRAEAEVNPAKVLADLQSAWATFKAEHTDQLAEIKRGYADVVKAEKVDRINSAVTDMQKALDAQAQKIAALTVGAGAGGNQVDPDVAAHGQAFNQFFRKGADAGLRELEVKAKLSVGSDPDGGYVVTPTMDTAITRVLGKVSAMRQLARVITISSSSYKKLKNVGGASSGWVGEKETRSETNTPQLRELEFPVMELYAEPHATQSLLDDAAVNIEQWLADEVSIEFAEQEGDAHINGDGVKKPRGVLAYDTVANSAWAWGKLGFVVTGAAADFAASPNQANAIIDLIYSLKKGYRQNARFLSNDMLVAKIRKFKDADGQYLWQPSLQVGEPASLMGYAHETDDNMPDVGANAFPLAFGDFARGYVIVDRTGARVLRDPFTAKPYVKFYTTKRVGGGVDDFQAIKLLKCSG